MTFKQTINSIKNIPGNVWPIVKKYPKTTALALAITIAGTYSGNEEGFPPIYNKKIDDCYGINVGLVTDYKEGSSMNGFSFSLISIDNGGDINGGDFSLIKRYNALTEKTAGKINGLEVAAIRTHDGAKSYPEVQGVQAGIVNNLAGHGNVLQLGGYNSVLLENGKYKRGLGANFKFGKGRKVPGGK